MRYLLLMTFTGSILFIGYCCWGLIFGRFLTQNMKYRALTIVLLTYLVPWAWLKRIYLNMVKSFVKERSKIEITMITAKIVTEKEDTFWTQDYRKLLLVSGTWLGVALLLLVIKLVAYFLRRKQLLQVAKKCRNVETENLLEALCRQVHFKRKPETFEISSDNDSFTLGIIKPVIFLQEDCTSKELELILRHEMVHIVRNDLFIKILLEFISCLYWFNPVVYFFKQRLVAVCESSCDELIVRNYNMDERTIYAKLIVRNMEMSPRRPALESSLTGNSRKTKERLVLIMNEKRRKTWEKVIAAGVFAVMLFANSLTALAYPNVYNVEAVTETAGEISVNGETMWLSDDSQDGYNFDSSIIQYDRQFVDENGNVYPTDGTSPYVFCLKHDIVSGYLQTHERKSNGGCEVVTYESTMCTNCNTVWGGDWVSTNTYNPCPH